MTCLRSNSRNRNCAGRQVVMCLSQCACDSSLRFPWFYVSSISFFFGCSQLFCLQLEACCSQWSFFTYSWQFSLFAYNWSFFAYNFRFLLTIAAVFCYSGKVRLISALRDCKQGSFTVSKKAPTVSKKASPFFFLCLFSGGLSRFRVVPWDPRKLV